MSISKTFFFSNTASYSALISIEQPLIEQDSGIEIFLQDHPQHAKDIQDNALLQKQLEVIGLQKKENQPQVYLALAAYFGIEVQEKETVFENGTTLLHFAALGGQESLMNELLGDGFHTVDAMDVDGASFVHYLAIGGHVGILQRFGSVYDYEINLHRIDESGKGIAEYAFLHKQIGVLEWLVTRKDFANALLFKDILAGASASATRYYEDFGIKFIQWMDQSKCYERLQAAQEPVKAAVSLFDESRQHLYSIISLQPVINTYLGFHFDRTDVDLINSIRGDLVEKFHVVQKTFPEGTFSQEVSFEEQAIWVLDELLAFKKIENSEYTRAGSAKPIATGACGSVYFVKSGGTRYALKKANHYDREYILTENKWLNYFRAVDPKGKAPLVQKIETVFLDAKLSIVLKLYDMSLLDLWENEKYQNGFSLFHIQKIARQIFAACLFLKEHGLVHGDVKPENILVDLKTVRVVLTDFDCTFRVSSSTTRNFLSCDLQTANYRSPECFIYALPYGHEIDVWSIGCVIAGIARDKLIFPTDSEEPDHIVMRQHHKYFGSYPKCLTDKARKDGNYTKMEPATDSIKEHLFTQRPLSEKEEQFLALVLATLKLDPQERISFEDALTHPFFIPES